MKIIFNILINSSLKFEFFVFLFFNVIYFEGLSEISELLVYLKKNMNGKTIHYLW